jgi:uncharacterized repeat protein (TIGR01451 family)
MRPRLAVLVLGFGLILSLGRADGGPRAIEVYTTQLTIPTYPYAEFLELHHSDLYNMDYPWLNWLAYEASGPQPVLRDYTALVVENPWLRLTFLPELGGRLYGVMVRATGEELLYQNPVIKPTHWGPSEQQWWLAVGGIEWCLPVDEHGYEWAVPWSYTVSTNTEGAIVRLWDTDASDRVRAEIQVYLSSDQAAFQITPRLENPTTSPVVLEFWHNAMLAPGAENTVGPDLRFVIPIDQVTVHSRGDAYLPDAGEAMGWPIHRGTDYSRLGNWIHWLGFFARPRAAQGWAGVFDEDVRRGVARVFPHQVAVGVKGFSSGWGQPIDSQAWTDDGSTYVELHGGPSPTFWNSITLDSGQVLEWTETWLPLRDLPALSLATSDLALGLKAEGMDLHFGLQVAGQRSNIGLRLWRKSDCTPLWRIDGMELSAGETFVHQLLDLGLGPEGVVLGVLEGSTVLALTGSLDCPVPSSQVDVLETVQTVPEFPVSWIGMDSGNVLTGYDLQVRDGDAEASWINWLTDTTATSAIFSGQDSHTYTFRSRARDVSGHLEAWPANGWQDAFTTVLLEPAPVLVTSDKVAQPLYVRPGDVMEFQIHLDNTGNLEASVRITDPLPACLELTAGPYINSPHSPAPAFEDGAITWNGMLAAGEGDVAIGFEARVLDLLPTGIVTNAVWIDDGVHPILRREVSTRCRFYLPAILKNTDEE